MIDRVVQLPVVADFIQGQHNDIQVVEEGSFFDILPQNLTDRLVQAVQNTDEYQLAKRSKQIGYSMIVDRHDESYFVFLTAAHDVEEQVNVTFVNTGHAVEHDDFGVGSVRLVEQVLLKSFLFFGSGQN